MFRDTPYSRIISARRQNEKQREEVDWLRREGRAKIEQNWNLMKKKSDGFDTITGGKKNTNWHVHNWLARKVWQESTKAKKFQIQIRKTCEKFYKWKLLFVAIVSACSFDNFRHECSVGTESDARYCLNHGRNVLRQEADAFHKVFLPARHPK